MGLVASWSPDGPRLHPTTGTGSAVPLVRPTSVMCLPLLMFAKRWQSFLLADPIFLSFSSNSMHSSSSSLICVSSSPASSGSAILGIEVKMLEQNGYYVIHMLSETWEFFVIEIIIYRIAFIDSFSYHFWKHITSGKTADKWSSFTKTKLKITTFRFCTYPIVKFDHYQQYDLASLSIANNTNMMVLSAMGKFYNGTLWAKSTFFGFDSKDKFIYTGVSAPKSFAKFGWLTWTFCHKNVEKAVSKLESDRL